LHLEDEKNQIASEIAELKFTSSYGPEIRKWFKYAIGIHQAGLLPKYRLMVEHLAQKGLLKIIYGPSPTPSSAFSPMRS
jgi:superfamily II RNA helicase